MIKILVCISNVPDTTTKIKFANSNKTLDSVGTQWIINPWDELALTRAIELKEAAPAFVQSVTVAHVGMIDAEPTIRKALAMGADDAIRVNATANDSYSVAMQLAEVIKNNSFDIILCGIESSDYNNSTVGGMLSEILGIPSVSSVSSITIENDKVQLKREIDGGFETISVASPFVAIAQKGIAKEARIPSMRGIMTARTKSLQVAEGVQTDALVEYVEFELPVAKSSCKKVDAENVKELINLLHNEAKVI